MMLFRIECLTFAVVSAQYEYGNLATFSDRTYDYADGEYQSLGRANGGSGDDAGLGFGGMAFYDNNYDSAGDGDYDATIFEFPDDDASFDDMMEPIETTQTSTQILQTTEATEVPTTEKPTTIDQRFRLDRRRQPNLSGAIIPQDDDAGLEPAMVNFEPAMVDFGDDYAGMFETEPVESAPLESSPVESAPIESAPVESVPVESAAVESVTVESAIVQRRPTNMANIASQIARGFGLFTSCLICEGETPADCKSRNSISTCVGQDNVCLVQIRSRSSQNEHQIFSRCMPLNACLNHEAQNFRGNDPRFYQCRANVADRWVRSSVCSTCHKLGKSTGTQLLFNNAAGDIETGDGTTITHTSLTTIMADPQTYFDSANTPTYIYGQQSWY